MKQLEEEFHHHLFSPSNGMKRKGKKKNNKNKQNFGSHYFTDITHKWSFASSKLINPDGGLRL